MEYHEVSKEHAKALIIAKVEVFGRTSENLVKIENLEQLNEFTTFYIN